MRGDRLRALQVRCRQVLGRFCAGPGEPNGPVVIRATGLHLILKEEPAGFTVRSGVTLRFLT